MERHDRKHSLGRLAVLVVAMGAILATSRLQAQESATVIDGVAAVVGKNIIKFSDIENAMLQVRMREGYESAQASKCELLESALISKLLVHKGQVDSVEVTDEEVETQVDYYLRNYIRQYGSKEALKTAMGFSYDEMHDLFFDMMKDRMLSQRVEHQLTQNIKVTPAEVAAYFAKMPKDSIPTIAEEYELEEIEIAPSIAQEEKERVKADLAELRERILKGERFAMLATLYSEDPGSAKKGGELGFFTRGDMVPEFEAAAFALKPGEVSPIIESSYGYHVLQLIERRGNTINVRHILKIPKVSSDDMLHTRVLLDSVANQIRLGNISFEEAAKKYSMAPNKAQGGAVTNMYTGNNRFNKEMASERYPGISFSGMHEGDISAALNMKNDESKDVYRIVRLKRKIEAHAANLTDDYDKIANAALQEMQHQKVMDWASKMIKTTYIHLSDAYKDCTFELNWTKTNK